MPQLFCNISWMREYQGHLRIDQPDDRPYRGGSWVLEHGTAQECCNFLPDDNGIIYGHVETWRDDHDTQIRIEKLGASIDDQYIDNVDVIWIATHEKGGRRVVGWYRNARVYRHRQTHEHYPTNQHKRDKVNSYRITAKKENSYLIPENDRSLKLGSGKGWPGHSPIFYPENYLKNKEMSAFLKRLDEFMNGIVIDHNESEQLGFNPESCGQSTVYMSDVRQMHRIHGMVVNELCVNLKKKYSTKVIFNTQLIDIAVADDRNIEKIFEVKTGNDKQSIYTGIGQLLFHSKANPNIKKILVLPQSNNGYGRLYKLFDAMGIWISEYYIDENDNITFEYLPD